MDDEWRTYPGGDVLDHWIDLEIRHITEGSDYPPKEHPPQFRASVKWDGCVHLWDYQNGVDPALDSEERVSDNSDYLHICNLEDHIATMQALLARARSHFGEDWPD